MVSFRKRTAFCGQCAWKRNYKNLVFTFSSLTNELEQCQQDCEEIKAKARRDRLTLENQLDMEKVRAEADRKKLQSQLEIAQKEKVSFACHPRIFFC